MPDKDDAPKVPDPDKSAAAPSPPTRRRKASTTAQITREGDMMRAGVDGVLIDMSIESVTLEAHGKFAPGDQLKIRLQNIVQRCEKEVRGAVRKAEPAVEGSMLVTIELFTRLTPLEMSLLKMGVARSDDDSQKWI
jgi:hypothetical protein